MPRSRPNLGSRQRTHSIAQPSKYEGASAEAPKIDKRRKGAGRGEQGRAPCRECGASVSCKKATHDDLGYDTSYDVRVGDMIYSNHREGGGVYQARKGDVLCKGAKLLVTTKESP